MLEMWQFRVAVLYSSFVRPGTYSGCVGTRTRGLLLAQGVKYCGAVGIDGGGGGFIRPSVHDIMLAAAADAPVLLCGADCSYAAIQYSGVL